MLVAGEYSKIIIPWPSIDLTTNEYVPWEGEEFKKLIGHEELFQISNFGYIWSNRKSGFLKPEVNRDGYRQVKLSVNGKNIFIKMSRAVLIHFDREPKDVEVARHKDGITINDHINNLEWGTHVDNEQDKKRHGTYNHVGELAPNCVFIESQVLEMYRLYFEEKLFIQQIADKFQAGYGAIWNIVFGVNWTHLFIKYEKENPELVVYRYAENIGRSKLGETDILEIYRLKHVECWKQQRIAEKFKLDQSTVSDILNGISWKHLYHKRYDCLNKIK